MDLVTAIKYYQPQINRILAIRPADRTHQDQALLEIFHVATTVEGFEPTHRHVKRGTSYQHVSGARVQTNVPLADNDEVEIYRSADEDGLSYYVRRKEEFHDGRFVAL